MAHAITHPSLLLSLPPLIITLNYQSQKDTEKEEKRKAAEARAERDEELRVEAFLAKWEKIKEERAKERAKYLRKLFKEVLPGDVPGAETPKEKYDKAQLMERIKKHIPVILRRADEEKVPMEVPEATELAKVSVVILRATLTSHDSWNRMHNAIEDLILYSSSCLLLNRLLLSSIIIPPPSFLV